MNEEAIPSKDIFADLDDPAVPLVRKRGRAPGSPRVAGSGRKAGTPNKTTADVRQQIIDRAAPVDVLVAIAAGKRMRCGSEIKLVDGRPRSVPIWQQPTIEQRLKAASTLLHKVAPDLKASEITADIASRSDVHVTDDTALTPLAVAHRLAFILSEANRVGHSPQIIEAHATPVGADRTEDSDDDRAKDADACDEEDAADEASEEAVDQSAVIPREQAGLRGAVHDERVLPPDHELFSKKTRDAYADDDLIETLADGAVRLQQAAGPGHYKIVRSADGYVLATAYSREDARRLAASIVEHGAYK